eukprot:TRINITY_DN60716_c0_g1_i1.p1 TRINITY_DN60716_c0_g1~~TRINITY_DN60716_c0_g1_i1.p1  ORF type:complete len:161 (+),score=39.81 TRINITY_DN60716_c0_g1_i1:84-566(+)
MVVEPLTIRPDIAQWQTEMLDVSSSSDQDGFSGSNAHCTVLKHRYVGCAIVKVASPAMRSALMSLFGNNVRDDGMPVIQVGDATATIKAHMNKHTNENVPTDIFVGWGSKREKTSPVPVEDVLDTFKVMIEEVLKHFPLSNLAPPPEFVPRSCFDPIVLQ